MGGEGKSPKGLEPEAARRPLLVCVCVSVSVLWWEEEEEDEREFTGGRGWSNVGSHK